MENSAYLPSSGHCSPALVVFSQAASGLQDALRIQRPFSTGFSMSVAGKELHRPLTTSSFGLRHMETYGLPAHILHHLQPQFLHSGLSLGSGAFRPLADLKAFQSSSAFTPPKYLKIETSDIHHSGGGIFSPSEDRILGPSPRTDSCSPASTSMSPQLQNGVKEEHVDISVCEENDHQSSSNAIENDAINVAESRRFKIGHLFGSSFGGGGTYSFSIPDIEPPAAHAITKTSFLFDHDFPNKKKKDLSNCPICGLTIDPGDLENHFIYELERLYKLNGTGLVNEKRHSESTKMPALPGDSGPDGRFETFQRIRANRQSRLRLKIRKRKANDQCILCTGRSQRNPDGINFQNQHFRKNLSNDDDETVDVEGYSEIDDWEERRLDLSNNQTRIGHHENTVTHDVDEVVVDAEEEFGPTQYTDSDIVMKNAKKISENDGTQHQSQVATVNSSGDVEVKLETSVSGSQQCDSNVSTSDAEPSSRAQIIEELRNRIRQLETENGGEAPTSSETEDYKCLICLEHYKTPVISTICWHVHCEECWLHTLGNKKVCPQCSMITCPGDLRRIFM